MPSIYDEVHREAMVDRRNEDIPLDCPDPSEYTEEDSAQQHRPNYEPGPGDPF